MSARSERQQHRVVIGAAPPLAASVATVALRVFGGTLARKRRHGPIAATPWHPSRMGTALLAGVIGWGVALLVSLGVSSWDWGAEPCPPPCRHRHPDHNAAAAPEPPPCGSRFADRSLCGEHRHPYHDHRPSS